MGQNQALGYAKSAAKQTFSDRDLRKLYERFQALDADHDGFLSYKDITTSIPPLENNPLCSRVVDILDVENKGTTYSNTKLKKLLFLFKVYDVNNDGYISNGDLFQILRQMVGDNLAEVQLQQLVDRTIIHNDGDFDGKLSFDEFLKVIVNFELEEKLALNI